MRKARRGIQDAQLAPVALAQRLEQHVLLQRCTARVPPHTYVRQEAGDRAGQSATRGCHRDKLPPQNAGGGLGARTFRRAEVQEHLGQLALEPLASRLPLSQQLHVPPSAKINGAPETF
jgi:hypothetical protein